MHTTRRVQRDRVAELPLAVCGGDVLWNNDEAVLVMKKRGVDLYDFRHYVDTYDKKPPHKEMLKWMKSFY